MILPTIHSNFGFGIEHEFEKKFEIWIDNFDFPITASENKIFILMEPNEIMDLNQRIIDNHTQYKYILTFEEDVLEKCSNAQLFEFGTKWVEYEKYNNMDKKFGVSFVCGGKRQTPGHRLRHEIWFNQDSIKIPFNFFNSSHYPITDFNNNKILGESKFPLFDNMFSICIENSIKDYYFSEKLNDCILCKSIPIYYGCKNIDNYYNPQGILKFNTLEELLNIVNNLNPEDYYSRINAIEENFKKAEYWQNYNLRLIERLEKL